MSHFVEFEWTTAVALRKPLIPCLLDDTPLPSSLLAVQGIDVNAPDAPARLLAALQAAPPPPAPGDRVFRVLGRLEISAPFHPIRWPHRHGRYTPSRAGASKGMSTRRMGTYMSPSSSQQSARRGSQYWRLVREGWPCRRRSIHHRRFVHPP